MAEHHLYLIQVNRALDLPLTYSSKHLTLNPGDWVEVPIGKGESLGLVLGPAEADPKIKPKAILSKSELPPLSPAMLTFLARMAEYTLASRGLILRMVLSGAVTSLALEPVRWFRRGGKAPAKLSRAREKVLEAFKAFPAWQPGELLRESGVSRSVITGLVQEGVLEEEWRSPAPITSPNPQHAAPTLSPAQQQAADTLCQATREGYQAILLQGVTGSGKTEVYFEMIAALLTQGKGQILVLMPEIALTERFINRFIQRFGTAPGVWHSGISATARGLLYRDLMAGDARIILGARSALLLPFRDLRAIIIDEEHDQSYKSEDRVIHHARDMAVLRASIEKIPVVLCSATPSLETYQNVISKRYSHLELKERFASREMPKLELVDLRKDPPEQGNWLSAPLRAAISSTLEAKNQALLFLNRRGYAPLTLCRACGFRFSCPTCTAWLVEHRLRGKLCCHHCGYTQKRPDACPSCAEEALYAYGPGVERITEEAKEAFPDARIMMLSSDLKRNMTALSESFAKIERGEVDLIVGTQLIAKGHHFPRLSLVGVVDGDLGLGQADLRAAERSFQLLTQVIGRAGRGQVPGRGIIQTLAPEHPVLQAFLGEDQNLFYEQELEERSRFGWPPLGRLAALIISSTVMEEAQNEARKLARTFPAHPDVTLLGPVEAPLFRLRNRFRFRLLIKSNRQTKLPSLVARWLEGCPQESYRLRIQVDIDPVSFM